MAKVLLGFMGVGKSSVAPYLDGRFVDMDQVIEEKIGMSIADFFAKAGEASFTVEARCRDIDKWELRDGKWVIVERVVAGDNTFMVTPRYFDDYKGGRDKVRDVSYDFFDSIK